MLIKTKNYMDNIQLPSISHSGIHISLFYKGLVRFYHRVAPYEVYTVS